MSQISSPWHDMFPKYYANAKERIQKIMSRGDKTMSVPYVDDDKDLLQVEQISDTEFIYTGKIKLRDILYRLKYFAHFNESETDIAEACTIKMKILGKTITTFTLEESKVGKTGKRGWQILIKEKDGSMPTYVDIMKSLEKNDSRIIAKAILKALETPLDTQDRFELKEFSHLDVHNVRMFILLTHIAEAAVPSLEALEHYSSLVKEREGNTEIKPKHGRTPMMDKIVRAKLRKIANSPTFSTEFSKEAFPSQETNGTQKSRERALKGHETNPLSDIEDVEDVTELATILANMKTTASDNN